jgi:hypothetical protein
MALYAVGTAWLGLLRQQNRGRADRERKVERVAETVGEEQLRDREGAVVRRDLEDAAAERLGAALHVVLEVDGALGKAGSPG